VGWFEFRPLVGVMGDVEERRVGVVHSRHVEEGVKEDKWCWKSGKV